MAGRPPAVRTLVRAIAKLSPAQLHQLLAQAKAPSSSKLQRLERQREKHVAAVKALDRQIAKLSGRNGSAAAPARTGRKSGRKKAYKLSAATRRKMSLAAKRRYAGKRTTAATTPAPAPEKKRRTMSPETRAKMAAAAKARWTKVKGSGVTAAP